MGKMLTGDALSHIVLYFVSFYSAYRITLLWLEHSRSQMYFCTCDVQKLSDS